MTPEQIERNRARSRDYMRLKRAADPVGMREKRIEQERRLREADLDAYLARLAAKQRRRRERNPERVRREDRERYHANPQPKKAISRKSEIKRKTADPDAFLRGSRERAAARLERDPIGARAKLRAQDHARRARKLSASGNGVTPLEWSEIVAASLGLCAYCNQPTDELTMDHVEPLARGGEHDPSNIAAACDRCNKSKNRSQLAVWLAKRRAVAC